MGGTHAMALVRPPMTRNPSHAYYLLQKYRGDLTSQLRIIGPTARTPIPPLVASGPGFDALQAAFLEAHEIAAIVPLMKGLLVSFDDVSPRSSRRTVAAM
jgi:hypothetical protein